MYVLELEFVPKRKAEEEGSEMPSSIICLFTSTRVLSMYTVYASRALGDPQVGFEKLIWDKV